MSTAPINTLILTVCTLVLTSCSETIRYDRENGPVAPEDALETFQLEPGFKIELLAAEPLLSDPVDMEIDEYGRLYVVEMHGYPLDKSGTGKIRLLSDTDGDGKMDKSVVFADQLVLPNGILRWKKGVLVSDAPHILYFEDTDGDGKADLIDTVLTGFSLSNPHINVNNPVYGLDNWIHLAHRGAITTRNYMEDFGDEGTEVYFPAQPAGPRLPKNADSRSVRFRPETFDLETTASRAQFGHTFDAWGHHLFADNQNHAFQEVLAAPYMSRNPDLLISELTHPMSDHGAAAPIFQITHTPDRQLFSESGVMTSASGITTYLGGAFPPEFNGNDINFICESVSNLVHADRLIDTGASTFISTRVGTEGKEFVASTDAWSRPVNLYVGPDGALYMLDYYRQIIEHPEWMSEEAIAAGGLYNGSNMGRIYRISAQDAASPAWTKGLTLGDAGTEELIGYLSDANYWWRINAQRLLVDRGDVHAIPLLEQIVQSGSAAYGRLHAMWTLAGLKALKPQLIMHALGDPVAGIRENAIKLAEEQLETSPDLVRALLSLQKDPDAKVRFQLLCTLGYLDTPEAKKACERILFSDIEDPWVQLAGLSNPYLETAALLEEALNNFKPASPGYASLVARLTSMIGTGSHRDGVRNLIRRSARATNRTVWQAAVLNGLSKGLERNGSRPGDFLQEERMLVTASFEHPDPAVREASLKLLKVIGISDRQLLKASLEKAARVAANRQVADENRASALHFMALGEASPFADLLKSLIVPQEQPLVQLAALKIFSGIPGNDFPDYVLNQWELLTPEIREETLDLFFSSPDRITRLLDAIEEGTIRESSLGWGRRARLMGLPEDDLRDRARAMFLSEKDEKGVESYQEALRLKGSMERGMAVFKENCGICHQVRGTHGVAYGPDLGTVQSWLPKDILANIINPNLSIAVGYDLSSIQLKNGKTTQGIIASEAASAVTLRTAPGAEETIRRQDIELIKILDMSAMPAISQLDQQEMADLLAFLRQRE